MVPKINHATDVEGNERGVDEGIDRSSGTSTGDATGDAGHRPGHRPVERRVTRDRGEGVGAASAPRAAAREMATKATVTGETRVAPVGVGRRRRWTRERETRGARGRDGRTRAGRVSVEDAVQDAARELVRASPNSCSHSLADRAYAASTRSATMRAGDRVACALSAHAIECACESGVETSEGSVSLVVSLALRRAMEANGERREIKTVVGYASDCGDDGRARATEHAWLEIEGKVIDVCAPGVALFEAARRFDVDHEDEEAMLEVFGEDALRGSGWFNRRDKRRPLTVLNVAIPIGGARSSANVKPASGLTLKPPPMSIDGADRAIERARYFLERVLAEGEAGERDFIAAAPPLARALYERIASARIETVDSTDERLARAASSR